VRIVVGVLKNESITLEPTDQGNVDLLVEWTLDPVAQGPYKRVTRMTAEELRDLFLHSSDRHYFLIRRTADGKPLGRFYYRAWRFDSRHEMVDWELNIFIAEPNERGKGYGTAAQRLASHYLLQQPETRSVFAYTYARNRAERRALEKAGLEEVGNLPHPYYRVKLPPEESVLYVRRRKDSLRCHGVYRPEDPDPWGYGCIDIPLLFHST
jgi:RimJ/RimL family protein N-acetyltransferase